jgi:PadR family transcriptional regulator PadR
MDHDPIKAPEQLRLLILAVLEHHPEHGYAIAQTINARSGGLLTAKEGTLNPALHLLQAEGHIQSRETEVSGRIRREYRLTPKGRQEVTRLRGHGTRQVRAILEVQV